MLTVMASTAWAEDAEAAYERAKAAFDRGRPFEALQPAEQAVALEPSTGRYSRFLRRVIELVLSESVRVSEGLSIRTYPRAVELSELCQRIANGDRRAAQVAKVELRLRRAVQERAAEAVAAAKLSKVAEARRLLDEVLNSRALLESVRDAALEVQFQEAIEKARSARATGDLRLALDSVANALSIRPADATAAAEQELVVQAIVTRARPELLRRSESEDLQDLGFAIFGARQIETECSPCSGRLIDTPKLASAYTQEFERLAAALVGSTSRESDWAACGLLAEARTVLGDSYRSRLESKCPADSRVPSLTLRLTTSRSPGCPSGDLQEHLADALPAGVALLGPGSRTTSTGSGVGADLEIQLQIRQCTVQPQGERNSRQVSSTYVTGTQQLVNPDYANLQAELQVALAEQARLQRAVQANPNDYFSNGGLIGVGFRIATIRRRLSNTPPFLHTELKSSYTFESFERGITGELLADLTIVDSTKPGAMVMDELAARDARWSSGARGVVAQDASGNRNREPALPAEAALVSELTAKIEREAVEKIVSRVPLLLTARAHAMAARGEPWDAIGVLALVKLFPVPESDLPLFSFKRDALGSLASLAQKSETLPELLGQFPTLLAAAGRSASSRSAQDDSSMLDRALDAVVSVRTQGKSGAGFFVSSQGRIVTNEHVVRGSETVEIELRDGSTYLGRVTAISKPADLALIEIANRNTPFLKLAPSADVRVGATVYAIGSPQGLSGTVTKGIVSAIRRFGPVQVIQIDSALNRGSSGGPVLLSDGRAIGVSAFGLTESEGLNFAVAVSELQSHLGL